MRRPARWRPGVLRPFRPLSLRARLLAATLVLVAAGLVVSDLVVLGTVRTQMTNRLDQQLQQVGAPLSHRTGQHGPGGPGISPFAADNQVTSRRNPLTGMLPSLYEVRMLSADGSVLRVMRQPMAPTDPGLQLPHLTPAQLTARCGAAFQVPGQSGDGDDPWRVLILPVERTTPATSRTAPAYVVVGASMDEVNSTVEKLQASFLLIGGVVLVVLGGVGFFAVRAGLRPLRRIENRTALIAAGELSQRMPELPASTEVGRLSQALNGMLDQIESAFAARAASEAKMRRFVADASHELRTPLAGIRGFAELYRMGALRDDTDVKRTMGRIEAEAQRLGGLVEDLLTLARLDEERPLDLAPMDLRTLAADALHDLTALDPTRPVSLTGPGGTGAPGAAPVLGDEARLRQVVSNLVGNAVKHTPPGTPVRIGVGSVDGSCLLEVADCGPGLTADEAERVFERFYRVDASRSRLDGGGAGLGLAIAAALTRAHGGELTLESGAGRGAVFRVALSATGS
ncbi:HAMP domain-containing histidine kinase [Kitasatospora sp. RB6PN24]|uniref:sensor histidine kinase n=1 Tax=Kitasatospora humi TaxID=2893891 RepID=UPI001E286630|nr:HAMP domain-containing sensor histidine kinase [Kitasatospora humi]MCC9311343.1 HAMP domain-containing histidine kinase [Kitasatospora humi]